MRETERRRVLLNFTLYRLILFKVFILKKKKLVIYPHKLTFIALIEKEMTTVALRKSNPEGFPPEQLHIGYFLFIVEVREVRRYSCVSQIDCSGRRPGTLYGQPFHAEFQIHRVQLSSFSAWN